MKTLQKLSQRSLTLRYKIVQLDLQINKLQNQFQDIEREERLCLSDQEFLKVYIKQLEQLIDTNPDLDNEPDHPLHKQVAQARNKWTRSKAKQIEIQRRKQNHCSIKLLAKEFLRQQWQVQLEQINALIQQIEKRNNIV